MGRSPLTDPEAWAGGWATAPRKTAQGERRLLEEDEEEEPSFLEPIIEIIEEAQDEGSEDEE